VTIHDVSESGLVRMPDGSTPRWSANRILAARHYLGAINRGYAYSDQFGVMVFANPSSRRLPQKRWLELVRWCLFGIKNGGSRQWKAARIWLSAHFPKVTTVVSYSDPSVGHTGALYKACGWMWAPTWHRLRPPPSGNGSRDGETNESVKDRWIYALCEDPEREELLRVKDDAIVRKALA
jgi:hypothetical protein